MNKVLVIIVIGIVVCIIGVSMVFNRQPSVSSTIQKEVIEEIGQIHQNVVVVASDNIKVRINPIKIYKNTKTNKIGTSAKVTGNITIGTQNYGMTINIPSIENTQQDTFRLGLGYQYLVYKNDANVMFRSAPTGYLEFKIPMIEQRLSLGLNLECISLSYQFPVHKNITMGLGLGYLYENKPTIVFGLSIGIE